MVRYPLGHGAWAVGHLMKGPASSGVRFLFSFLLLLLLLSYVDVLLRPMMMTMFENFMYIRYDAHDT